MLDGRTREARLLKQIRRDLTAHVGGVPTATLAGLIERAAWLTLHLTMIDGKVAAGSRLTDHDARSYLGWANALSRILRQIGLSAAKPKAPTLADHLRGAP